MSAETRAHVKADWVRDGVAIAIVGQRAGQRTVRQWTQEYRTYDHAEAISDHEDGGNADWLRIADEEARALYEALAEHYGHTGNDVRALRKDYDAERGRVDKFIAHLTGGGSR